MMMRSQAEALARLVHLIREDWDYAGLMAAIHRAHELGDPAAVSVALLQLAADPDVKTPGMLPMPGKHWRGTTAAKVRRDPGCVDHPGQPAGRCRLCVAEATPTPADFKTLVSRIARDAKRLEARK